MAGTRAGTIAGTRVHNHLIDTAAQWTLGSKRRGYYFEQSGKIILQGLDLCENLSNWKLQEFEGRVPFETQQRNYSWVVASTPWQPVGDQTGFKDSEKA